MSGNLKRPGFAETFSFISRDHIEHVALCIEVLFSLCGRDVSDGAKQTSMVEPIDPSEGGHVQILHIAAERQGVIRLIPGIRWIK